MAKRRCSPAGLGVRLPHELIHFWIIPDLLSEYLHGLLTEGRPAAWHPFCMLPLVSKAFKSSCRSHAMNIFGLEIGDGEEVIVERLETALNWWKIARIPPPYETFSTLRNPPSYRKLISKKSLIQVYVCIAQAKAFYNIDVRRPIELEEYLNSTGEHLESTDWELSYDIRIPNWENHQTRQYKMKDHTMHRLFRPMTAAINLCDEIQPENLAYYAANYLAKNVPLFTATTMMLKNSQDLETHLIREYGLDQTLLLDWTSKGLDLISQIKELIMSIQQSGKLVQSFMGEPRIPRGAIQDTNIVNVLNAVALSDWGESTVEIREGAESVREDLEAEIEVTEEVQQSALRTTKETCFVGSDQ